MAGRATAPQKGKELENKVAELALKLGLEVRKQVKAGSRIWGKKRKIDLVLRHPETKQVLGIECKAQTTKGTAEEKILATVEDIKHWPIPGIIVMSGKGFSDEMKGYLISTGITVTYDELEEWLKLYFGID